MKANKSRWHLASHLRRTLNRAYAQQGAGEPRYLPMSECCLDTQRAWMEMARVVRVMILEQRMKMIIREVTKSVHRYTVTRS